MRGRLGGYNSTVADHLAYFVTLSAYGDRVHGDERGSVDRRRNVIDEPRLDHDPRREDRERALLKFPPMRFTSEIRNAIEESFAETCTFRGWLLLAIHCRTNHVHCVLSTPEVATSEVLHRLKSRATRALRAAGLVEPDQSVWSRHGSTRILWTDDDVAAAIDYTLNHQGADLPGTGVWRELHQPGEE